MAGKDTVQEIKDRLSVADIISPYVKLRRAGRSMVGLCPFHKEKTPSFHVSPERGTWHCFGCGLGGDGFSFIEKIEGVDFKGALKMLAEKAGVQIEEYRGNREVVEKRDRLRALMARVAEWYAGQLPGSAAEAYAKKRGLSDETIKEWGLGFAPDAWRALLEAMGAEGYAAQELLAAGLVKEADGKPGTYYDRFRNRLLFPIRDTAGRVVAFTGRALASDEQAKYLNSPETDLYHKSDILFGLDRARDAIRTRGFTLLAEGQMDVLHCHQAGFGNAVALSGTALTEAHLALMKRFSDNLMLVLDADAAGQKATARSAELALWQGLRVKAARLAGGKDPADLISEDPALFKERIVAAQPIVEFFLAVLTEQERDPHRLLRAVEAIVLPLIRATPSPMERDHAAQVTARALGLSVEAVKESVGRVPRMSASESGNVKHSHPEVGMFNIPMGAGEPRPEREIRDEQVRAVIRAYPGTPLAGRAESEYCRITGALQASQDVPPESAVFDAERTYGDTPDEGAADELLHAFERAVVREAYQEAVANLRRAEAQGVAQAVDRAQEACAELSRRLATLG
jgi:DNA primase